MAAIEWPVAAHAAEGRAVKPRTKAKAILCLPKGLVDPGEKALEAALREVREETGITAVPITKLADIKYVYVRSWGDGERVFKIVSFYLLRYESGRIDNITEAMRIEVARARWMRLEDGPEAAGLSRREADGAEGAGVCGGPSGVVMASGKIFATEDTEDTEGHWGKTSRAAR